MDSTRGSWVDWELDQPASKLYDLFSGEPGHIYYFRCRATDKADNISSYPDNADTQIKVDPQARPSEPWWDNGYSTNRHLTVLNNMPDVTLPSGYPVHLHFDAGTTPSSSDIYAASQAASKCDDLRVIYNNATQLDRLVVSCTSSDIDLWFRTQAPINGGTEDSSSYQLYYGNPSPGYSAG